MSDTAKPTIINARDAEEHRHLIGDHWGGTYRVLTPSMRARGGKLGVNMTRVPPGRVCVPFHYHQLEDEAFYILEGKGVFRYGDELSEVTVGDCIACPAGTQVAHQLANPFDSDLVYLAIGNFEKNEVCVYPDNGKVMVRGVGKVGFIKTAPYMEGEPDRPKVMDLIAENG